MSLKLATPVMIERTCLRVSQPDALWYASAKACKYDSSEGDNLSTPRASFIAEEEVRFCHKIPAFSGETVFKTADTISVALFVWRSFVLSAESLQLIHGFPSGSSLHDKRNSFSFPRCTFDIIGADSSL